jgi:hypothetical protein
MGGNEADSAKNFDKNPRVSMLRAMPTYARVMVDDSGGNAFDYELPPEVAARLQIGSRVRVPGPHAHDARDDH